MTLSQAIIMAVFALAQNPAAGAGGAPGGGQPPGYDVRVVGVLAAAQSDERPAGVDSEIKGYKALLERLPYESFTLLSQGTETIPTGVAKTFPIDSLYDVAIQIGTTQITMSGGTPTMGNVEAVITVEDLKHGGIAAIQANASLAVNQPVLFRGLPHEDGEVVVIVSLGGGEQQQDQQQNQDQQNQDQQENEEEQEQEEQEEEQEEQEPQEQQDQQEQQQEEEQEESAQPEEPKDRQEIEALLDMLEAMDKQLQEEPDKRSASGLRGQWW